MQECLADTGVSLLSISIIGFGIVVASVLLFSPSVRHKFRSLITSLMVLGAALILPSNVSAATPCPATANADVSSGVQGAVQTFSILDNDLPSEGASFVLSSLSLELVSNPVPGSVFGASTKTVYAPSEGDYIANSNGTISYTPDANFVGTRRGVTYSIIDTDGVTMTSPSLTVVKML